MCARSVAPCAAHTQRVISCNSLPALHPCVAIALDAREHLNVRKAYPRLRCVCSLMLHSAGRQGQDDPYAGSQRHQDGLAPLRAGNADAPIGAADGCTARPRASHWHAAVNMPGCSSYSPSHQLSLIAAALMCEAHTPTRAAHISTHALPLPLFCQVPVLCLAQQLNSAAALFAPLCFVPCCPFRYFSKDSATMTPLLGAQNVHLLISTPPQNLHPFRIFKNYNLQNVHKCCILQIAHK